MTPKVWVCSDVMYEQPSKELSLLVSMYKVEHTTIFNLELAFIFCSSTHTAQLRAEAEMWLAGLLERLRWSTSHLGFGSSLLDDVIYLKLENKQF